ncbi:MAG: zinc dependent phospholipase C family protein [Acidobacteriaceae bacterium]|nr:zinc dependent phospholipase C family protein [Acidobacteriaceae bacterium]
MRTGNSLAKRACEALAILYLFAAAAPSCFGCSVLAHEALVDALWDIKVKPVLLARYPAATAQDLQRAHGFAYGGAIIQDLGYYPHGSHLFSDLTHYVRTGDFVLALIRQAHDLNELAFALGALSHYSSDIDVHRLATNPGEPMLYPKLMRKFGPAVTYEQNPAAHLKTEFGFDVLEVAKGNFAPQSYHDFIGFYVAEPLLARAFLQNYGINVSDIFPDFHRSVESYRRAVSKTIPKATRVAWAQRAKQIRKSEPGITRRKFVYVMRRSSYEREWGKQYDRPSAGERVAAIFLKLLPPVGPLRTLRFKMPTPRVEKFFMQSFDLAASQYRAQLDAVTTATLQLSNYNYDLGEVAEPGKYRLADRAYANWVNLLARKNYQTLTSPMKASLLAYYRNVDLPFDTKRKPAEWNRLLMQLREINPQPIPAGGP